MVCRETQSRSFRDSGESANDLLRSNMRAGLVSWVTVQERVA